VNDRPPLHDARILHGASADAHADLHSTIEDIAFAQACAALLLEQSAAKPSIWVKDQDSGSIEKRALWTAALISYGRCFTGGLRMQWELPLSLTPELLACHERVITMRNQHLAHSVSDLEQAATFGTWVEPQPGSDRPFLVAAHGLVVNHPGRGEVTLFVALCEALMFELSQRQWALGSALKEEYSALTAQEWVALPPAQIAIPLDSADASRRRKRSHRTRRPGGK